MSEIINEVKKITISNKEALKLKAKNKKIFPLVSVFRLQKLGWLYDTMLTKKAIERLQKLIDEYVDNLMKKVQIINEARKRDKTTVEVIEAVIKMEKEIKKD